MTTTYKRPWFSYIQGHKIQYIVIGIAAMWGIITIFNHDLDIWLGVRDGSYDANALGQLYFRNVSYETLHSYAMVALSMIVLLVAYAIVVGIARHKYNNV